MGITGTILAVSALFFCVYLYLELQKKLSSEDVGSKLRLYSEELNKDYARQFRNLETEWTDIYAKMSKLAGRIDKTKALESPPTNTKEQPRYERRSDLVRRHRGGSLE
jgi:hypothetical protein